MAGAEYLTFWICTVIFIVHEWNTYVQTAPVYTHKALITSDDDLSEALNYMTKYGFLRSPGSVFGYAHLVNLIKDVQFVLHVNQTGELDDDTMTALRRPRCGVKDAPVEERSVEAHVLKRNKRYTINWHKWDNRFIKYRILNYPTDSELTNAQVDEAVDRAVEQFSNVTRLIFKKITDNGYADIFIKFESWNHGDGYPFDGPNGTVAHAFVPEGIYGDYDGDVHFDDSEDFTHEGEKGYNLYQVALHEIGHSLGLEHSWVDGAVMIPDYPGYNASYALTNDEIRALQLLYGPRIPISNGKPLNPDAPCNLAYDAATMIDNKLFVFKDNRYWRLTDFETLLSYKKGQSIKKRFRGVPTPIDAIYQRPQDGNVLIFKGSQYWMYNKRDIVPSYPRSVTDLGLPDNLDAAIILDQWNKTYFFKDTQVWRYDEENQAIDYGYPYHIREVWEGTSSSTCCIQFYRR
ncbi:collagenase 3-like [Amphiura filiformis]|uniref:collagenase 3-like n=1 Tax=Amphiura filiformis TaxID=82378 RepID=UPI003B21532C